MYRWLPVASSDCSTKWHQYRKVTDLPPISCHKKWQPDLWQYTAWRLLRSMLLSSAKGVAWDTKLMVYAVGQFWPAKCSSGRLCASLRCRDSDSGLADETQLTSRPWHLTTAVGPSASRVGSFTGRTTERQLYTNTVKPALNGPCIKRNLS